MYCRYFPSGACVILSTLALLVCAGKVPEQSFPEAVVVHNKTVACRGKSTGKHYPSPVYTCENITVDGELLLHGYMDPIDKETSAGSCLNCPCGQVTDHPNDMYSLCKHLLASSKLGQGENLFSAHIPHPICKQKGPEKRVKFIQPQNLDPYWDNVEVENGYVYTLQCITLNHSPV